MKTAPFNLERYLAGDPIVYKCGEIPKESYYFRKADDKTTTKLVTLRSNGGYSCHESNGNELFNPDYDLLMLITPIKKSCWINIYKYGKVEGGFGSEKEANEHYLNETNSWDRVACIEIHWEE